MYQMLSNSEDGFYLFNMCMIRLKQYTSSCVREKYVCAKLHPDTKLKVFLSHIFENTTYTPFKKTSKKWKNCTSSYYKESMYIKSVYNNFMLTLAIAQRKRKKWRPNFIKWQLSLRAWFCMIRSGNDVFF